MQMIKFISCPNDLIDKDILKEPNNYFADKDGFKIKKSRFANFLIMKNKF